MILVVGCETIKEAISTPTPTPLPTATPFPAIDVKDLTSQYQYDPLDGEKSDFKKKYQGKNLQIYVKGLIAYHGRSGDNRHLYLFITYDEMLQKLDQEGQRQYSIIYRI